MGDLIEAGLTALGIGFGFVGAFGLGFLLCFCARGLDALAQRALGWGRAPK